MVNKYILKDKLINKNLKILSITDVHSNYKYLNKVRDKLRDINPDYIFFVGDTFDAFNNKNNDKIIKLLKIISNNYNTFICLGNHDLLEYKKILLFKKCIYTGDLKYFKYLEENTKIHVLIDDFYEDDLLRVYAFNLSDDWYHVYKEDKLIFNKEFNKYLNNNKMRDDKFTILLLHSSNGVIDSNELKIDNTNINLILCGHNHGGITPRFIRKLSKNNRGLVLPNRGYFKTGAYGIYSSNNTSLLLSSGLTKFGKSHLGNILSIIGNNIIGADIELIYLSNGNHELSHE